jgi:hypothetical protein
MPGPTPQDDCGPVELERVAPVKSEADAIRQALADGQPFVRTKLTNGYWTKFAARGETIVRRTFLQITPVAPGVDFTLVIGSFRVPDQMTLQLRRVRFDANRSSGGTEIPIEPGQYAAYLGFSILVQGSQIGVSSFAEEFGLPPSPNIQTSGVGDAQAEDHAFYAESGKVVSFTMTVTAGMPVTVTSSSARVDGILIETNALEDRLRVR